MPRMTKADIAAARRAGLVRQGAYLRKLRTDAMLTQREVGKALDVDPNLVQHWESGRCWVSLEHQEQLAETLNVAAAVLVLRLSLFRNPVLSAVVWRTPDRQGPAQGCPACP